MGFLWRLSRVNGFLDTQTMLRQLGLSQFGRQSCLHRGHLIKLKDALAPYFDDTVVGVISALEQSLPVRSESTQSTYIKELRTHLPRYCKRCLASYGYIHCSFEHSLMTVCPIHGTSVSEACPRCGEEHRWGLLLHTRCHKCGSAWTDDDNQRAIPKYQTRFMSNPDGKWLSAFTKQMLMIARPLDAIHQPIPKLKLKPQQITSLLEHAWRLMFTLDMSRWSDARARRFQHLQALNIHAIGARQVITQRSWTPVRTQLSSDQTLPRWLSQKFSSAYLENLVDTETAISLLGLRSCASKKMSKQIWLKAQQFDANQTLASLGIIPVNQPNIITHFRYHVDQLNFIAEQLPEADSVDFIDGEWVYANDPRFRVCHASIIDLIIAVANDWLTGGRKGNAGMVPLKVEASEFDQWLLWRLGRVCAQPIKLIDARSMCSLSLKQARALVERGVWQFVKGPELHATYVAGSLVKEYILQQGDLSANHSMLGPCT